MEVVVGLLLMLIGVCHGIESRCDGRQDGAQCYGALGGTLVLQLMDRTSDGVKYEWIKNNSIKILYVVKSILVFNEIKNRSLFVPSNGTFMINNLSRSDGDKYVLRIYKSGQLTGQRPLQLSIQAPVSSVQLGSECLSQGELRVSCSSEGGDSPQYSWTLDGHTLTDAELLSGNSETSSITLKQHVSGLLVCSVRNHISRVSEEMTISTCDNLLRLLGLLAAVAFLLLGGIGIYFSRKKKKYRKAEAFTMQQRMDCADINEMVEL